MGDSVKGGWHCPGRVVPPSPRRVLTRGEIAGLASSERVYEHLYDMAEGGGFWQQQLARLDAHPQPDQAA